MKRSRVAPTIFLLGPQGCGKGTQAKLLAKKYHLVVIDTGAMLRAFVKEKRKTPAHRSVLKAMQAGKLVPSSMLHRLLLRAVARVPKDRGLLFDGATRKLGETRVLMKDLLRMGRPVTHSIVINISEKESMRRLLGRARFDDTPTVIRKRLALYHRTTKPVLIFLRKKTPFFLISGEASIKQVFRMVDGAYRKGLDV